MNYDEAKKGDVMKRVINIIGLVLTVFLMSAGICANSFAATYYIDFAGGSDSNTGISSSSPFKHSPGDGNATSLSAATTLSAGDVVLFKGGISYNGNINVNASGTAGNPITFDGNSAGTWGTGRAIIDMKNTYEGAFSITGKRYIDINNFEMKFAKYGGADVRIDGASYINVRNCYIHSHEDWDMASGPNKLGSYIRNSGLAFLIGNTSAVSNVVVDNCEITKMGVGIAIKNNSSYIEIKNCSLHDYMVWFIDLSLVAPTNTMSNILIHDNKIYNMYHYSQSYWNGTKKDEKLNYSTEPNPHEDGIFFRGNDGGIFNNIRIYNNDFYNDIEKTEDGGTAWLFIAFIKSGSSIYVYNNTFQNPYPNDAIALGWNQENGYKVKVYQNTFSLSKGNGIQITEYLSSATHEWHIKNNLFYIFNGSTSAAIQPLLSGGTCSALWGGLQNNGNLFDVGAGKISNSAGGGCGSSTALLSQWRADSGDELTGKQGSARLINPLTGARSGASNLRLGSGSAAIDAGIPLNLNDYPGADRDKDGNLRPKRLGWDIGAYESDLTGDEKKPGFPQINLIQ